MTSLSIPSKGLTSARFWLENDIYNYVETSRHERKQFFYYFIGIRMLYTR